MNPHGGQLRALRLEEIRAALELSPMPAAIVQWGKLLFLNRAARQLLGDDQAERSFQTDILGASPGEGEDMLRRRAAELREHGETIVIPRKPWVRRRGKWIRQDGKSLILEVKGWRIPLEGGDATQVTFRKTTAGDRAGQERPAEEDELRLAMDCSEAGEWEFDPIAGMIRLSKRCGELLQIPGGNPMDYRSFLKRIQAEDRQQFDTDVLESLCPEANGKFRSKCRIRCPDGTVRWIATKGHVFFSETPNGRKATRVIGIMFDVSDLRRADLSLRQTERLATAEQLAATLAHEINNPLEAMTNLLYLLEGSSLDPEQRKYVTLAREQLSRVIDSATHSLRFYRDPENPTECRISEAVDSALAIFSTQIAASKIRIERRDWRDASVFGSRGELRQVLANLIHNAVDAMPNGGRLLVRTKAARKWPGGRRGIRITIADSGQGMSCATRARIFEPFFSTRVPNGMGLGLWLCAGIVREHGGTIRLRSRECPEKSAGATDEPVKAGGTVCSIFLPSDRRR